MKIRPVGAELIHADRWTDGRTDVTKLMVAFRNIANPPINMYMLRTRKEDENFIELIIK
jgi:hypothetical protein